MEIQALSKIGTKVKCGHHNATIEHDNMTDCKDCRKQRDRPTDQATSADLRPSGEIQFMAPNFSRHVHKHHCSNLGRVI